MSGTPVAAHRSSRPCGPPAREGAVAPPRARYRPWRPLKLDLSYLLSASRFATGAGTDRFQDLAGRSRWRAMRGVRLLVRGRYRVRDRLVVTEDGFGAEPEAAMRGQVGLRLDRILGSGAYADGGAILDRGGRHGKTSYFTEAGHQGPWWQAGVGWRGTVRDPDDGLESTAGGAPALDPYSRNVRQAAYLRVGAYGAWLDGYLSVDHDLEAEQTMVFAQVGTRWR